VGGGGGWGWGGGSLSCDVCVFVFLCERESQLISTCSRQHCCGNGCKIWGLCLWWRGRGCRLGG